MEEKLIPVSAAIVDPRVNTLTEIKNVKKFLENGHIQGTSKTSLDNLNARLKNIGYRLEDHDKYEFFFEKSDNDYGNDFRKIYIKPLNEWFAYI